MAMPMASAIDGAMFTPGAVSAPLEADGFTESQSEALSQEANNTVAPPGFSGFPSISGPATQIQRAPGRGMR